MTFGDIKIDRRKFGRILLVGAAALAIPATTAAASPVSILSDEQRLEALRKALTRRGTTYKMGGDGPNTFDCSGLVLWSFKPQGLELPHKASRQWNHGAPIDRNDLMPGDAVFYGKGISHVGIYTEDGRVMQALGRKWGVNVWDFNWAKKYQGARRF